MLRIDRVETIEGITVHEDDREENKFYLLPEHPRFRLDDDGTPVFKYLKYRFPLDRGDGEKGGGYCFFDTELVVPEEKKEAIRSLLQERLNARFEDADRVPEVELAPLTYTDGTAALLIKEDGGALVEDVQSAGKPSLVGRNIAVFNMELSQFGATLFASALQGKGGVAQVRYDLKFYAQLPPLKGKVWFNASKFYDYYHSFVLREDQDGFFENVWEGLFGGDDRKEIKEEIRETFRNKEIMGVALDFTRPPDLDEAKYEKLTSRIRDWAWRTLEDAVQRMAAKPLDPATGEERGVPEDVTDFERAIEKRSFSSFRQTFKEEQTVIWDMHPQGTLPNITNLTDAEGNPIEWEDYAQEVDLDDEFFQQLNVDVRVNADFEALSIFSVEVHLEYEEGEEHTVEEFAFTSPEDTHRFASYIANDKRTYQYWYEVHYRGESRTFKSEVMETDETVLTIGVDEAGVLLVDVSPGDLNFSQVPRVQLTIQYEDAERGVALIERRFTIDEEHPTHQLKEVIFEPVRRPYRYRRKYFMADGREYEVDWVEERAQQLYVNDPFSVTKTVGLRALGDLTTKIDTIFVDLTYTEEGNGYTQHKSIALSADLPFFDWSFPVIDERAGEVTYKGLIRYADGTNEDLPETVATGNTILVGEKVEERLTVDVLADLIDVGEIELVEVDLRYEDAENGIQEQESLIFRPEAMAQQSWTVALEDEDQRDYQWQATFYMKDGTKQQTPLITTSDSTIILEMPTAEA